MKLLLFAFLASSAAAAEFGGRRPALRALQQDEQLLDVQQDIEFSMSMASAGSAMEGEAKSAKSSKLFKSSKTSGDEEICVPPSNSTGPVYPDDEQQEMLIHQATDGGKDLSYLSEAAYNETYGDNEMEEKIITFAGRLPSKDFPSNVAVIFGEDLGFLDPELLGFIETASEGSVTAVFVPSRIDGINSVLEAKSLCATICEELPNCLGFEFVEFGWENYNCIFIKEGIAVISDYPQRQISRTATSQTSLLIKDPSQFMSSNWCDVPQGTENLEEAVECFGLFSDPGNFILKGCLEVGANATFLLSEEVDSLQPSGACITTYLAGVFSGVSWDDLPWNYPFPKEVCNPLIEEDFVKHIVPALACLGEVLPDATAVKGCLDCVFEKAVDTCASVCDEEEDGTVTFLKPCECADSDEQCECKCKSCGDVCPQTECTAFIQSGILCSVGTGPYDGGGGGLGEYTGCINSNIEGSPQFLENDFECAYKEEM